VATTVDYVVDGARVCDSQWSTHGKRVQQLETDVKLCKNKSQSGVVLVLAICFQADRMIEAF